jgi:poly(3-hydroxybutyrate) depolymerase
MMANRMWCERGADFDGFAALAGPASVTLRSTGTAPCAPSVTRPYLGIVGDADTVLQTTSNWSSDTWTITPRLTGGPSFVNDRLVNEEVFHREVRVPSGCSGTASAPTTDGAFTVWSDCNGRMQLKRVAQSDHCIAADGACATSLEGASGHRMRDEMVAFFASHEP